MRPRVYVFGFILAMLPVVGAPTAVLAQKEPAKVSPVNRAPAMAFSVVRDASPGCEPTCIEWIKAEGEITQNTAAEFRRFIARLGKRKLPILIHSPGGHLEASIEISRLVRQLDLPVMVARSLPQSCFRKEDSCGIGGAQRQLAIPSTAGAICNSSCGMVLAGGNTRVVARDSSVGVHSPMTQLTRQMFRTHYRIVTRRDDDGRIIREKQVVSRETLPAQKTVIFGHNPTIKRMERHYASMGIGDGIMEPLRRTPFEKIHVLTQNELDLFGMRNVTDARQYLTTLREVARKSAPPAQTSESPKPEPLASPDSKVAVAALPSAPRDLPLLPHDLSAWRVLYFHPAWARAALRDGNRRAVTGRAGRASASSHTPAKPAGPYRENRTPLTERDGGESAPKSRCDRICRKRPAKVCVQC